MRTDRTALVTCLVLAAAIPGSALGLESTEITLSTEHAIASGGSFRVENLLGSTRLVAGGEAGTISIEARVVAEGKTVEEAADLAATIRLETRNEDEALSVHVAFPVDAHPAFRSPESGMKGLIKRWAKPLVRNSSTVDYDDRLVQVGPDRKATGLAVHLTVTVPYDLDIDVRQSVGPVAGRAMRGNLRVATEVGDIELERCFGSVEATSGAGRIAILQFQGTDVVATTDVGDIDLQEARAERASLRTQSGPIRVSGVTSGELIVESASGHVKLDGMESNTADIRTGSSDIDISSQIQSLRQASIETATGDVMLRVGKLSHFDLLAETEAGTVKTRDVALATVAAESPYTRLRHGRGGAEVRVSARGGSIAVRRYESRNR